MATVQFGVVTAPGSYGFIQNYSETNNTEVGEARDENGDVAAIHTYNEKKECSFEYVFDTDSTAPEAGDTLTANGSDKFLITEVVKSEENQGFKKITVQGTHYIPNSLPSS